MDWWNRRQRERDLERELASDLELEAEEQQQRGLPVEQARLAARRAMGNVTRVQEDARAAWGWTFLDRLAQDIRYALRGMRRSPGFTATAVISLALGIGANTAIFSLIDAVLLRWLPVHDPQNLVQVTILRPNAEPLESFSYPLAKAVAQHREILSHTCTFSSAQFSVRDGDAQAAIPGAWMTGECYETLGLQPLAGRLFAANDDSPGAPPVAVISDGYWQRRFGRDPQAIGRQLIVEGKPVTIAGVSPAGFDGANVGQAADITMPLGILAQITPDNSFQLNASSWWLRVLARPRPGISRQQAKARLAVLWPGLMEDALAIEPGVRKRLRGTSPDVIPGGTGFSLLRNQFRRPLMILMGVVGLLLLIACANVANLLTARAAARQREIAVRLAIGAHRARIVRQLLTEGLLLSICGAAAGVLLAWAGSRALVDLLSGGQVRAIVLDVRPDWLVLAFTAVTACGTGILFGIAPAFRGTAAGPGGALREKITIARSRIAPVLVTIQVSLAMLLLVAGGLFIRTLQNLHHVNAGFRSSGVLLASANGGREGYRGAGAASFYEGLLKKVEALPGIRSASYSLMTPLEGGGISQDVAFNGQRVSHEQTNFNSVSRGFFPTMGTPLLMGRDFDERDTATSPHVAIVNQVFVRRYVPDGKVLGQRLTVGTNRTMDFEIVGVVGDSLYETLRESAPPTVYSLIVQREGASRGGFGVVFEAYAAGSAAAAANGLRNTLQPALPGSPVRVHALEEQVERAMLRERMMATLASGFAFLGLVLAAVGLYGLLTYTVARRTNEIGIRLALGAKRQEVLWMIIRSVLVLLAGGVAIGIPAAWAASRFIASMLFGVQATDGLTIATAIATLTVAGLAAGFVPAWRASRVDPMVALRYE